MTRIGCKPLEDNTRCIIVAESERLTPRTNYIAIPYHHFRDFVKTGAVNLYLIGTRAQQADNILTKPLDEGQAKCLHSLFLHW